MNGSKWQVAGLAGLALALVAGSAVAAETAPHKGVFVGGGVMTGAETGPIDRFGGGAAARVGYGVSDKVLLYYDNSYFYTRRNGTNFNFYDGQARVQYFPYGNWFLATGGGVAVGKPAAATGTKIGYTTTTSAGYEFRPKENMGLSIESGFNYKRISGTNFYSPQILARLDWFF